MSQCDSDSHEAVSLGTIECIEQMRITETPWRGHDTAFCHQSIPSFLVETAGEHKVFRLIHKAAERFFDLRLTRISYDRKMRLRDLTREAITTIERAQPHTMTSLERLAALCLAVEYVVGNDVPGAFVECGVWKGGSSMAAALTLIRLGREDVELFMFDTFEGMSEPGEEDRLWATGEKAKQLLAASSQDSDVRAFAPIDTVKRNLESTGYPTDHLHFVKGMVEDTIPDSAPAQISLLRLDTDWYESTKHELIHLFPRISRNGILIIDDYGDWAGARKAVDEYFAAQGMKPFLGRIDGTGRIYVKC
jgi:O-methyltransferase